MPFWKFFGARQTDISDLPPGKFKELEERLVGLKTEYML